MKDSTVESSEVAKPEGEWPEAKNLMAIGEEARLGLEKKARGEKKSL